MAGLRSERVRQLITADLESRHYHVEMEIDLLGEGTYGFVYRVTDEHGTDWAAKISTTAFQNNPQMFQESYEQETMIFDRIGTNTHKNLITLKEKFTTEDVIYLKGYDNKEFGFKFTNYFIIMSYAPYGSVSDEVLRNGPMKETLVKSLASDLFSAVRHLHSLSISHLDIKVENCLLVKQKTGMMLQLADFGLSTLDQTKSEPVGTLFNMAPETIRSYFVKPSQRLPYATKVADLWSIGSTIYFMLNMFYPITNFEDEINDFKAIFFSSGVSFGLKLDDFVRAAIKPSNSILSQHSRNVLSVLLETNPKTRAKFDSSLFEKWKNDQQFSADRAVPWPVKSDLKQLTKHVLSNNFAIATFQQLVTYHLAQHGYHVDMFQDYLGMGRFGVVYRTQQNGNNYAIKIFSQLVQTLNPKFSSNAHTCREYFENETSFYAKLGNQIPSFIVGLKEHFTINDQNGISIQMTIMEYAIYGSLEQLVARNGPLEENFAKFISHDLFKAVNYLHNHQLTHLDIKPSNCLIFANGSKFALKLSGFGHHIIENYQMFQVLGTIQTLAPELLYHKIQAMKRVKHKSGTPWDVADLWSLGSTIYFMFHQEYPMLNKEEDLAVVEEMCICNGQPQSFEVYIDKLNCLIKPINNELSDISKRILTGLLQINPDLRKNFDSDLFKMWTGNKWQNLEQRIR